MKPPETVTLIDLGGKPVLTINLNDAKSLSAYIEFFIDEDGGNRRVDLKIGGYKTIFWSETHSDLEPICNLLNDQLTLIRKGLDVGHFNDLAIYQTTLGRYWEVPWYNIPSIWKELEPLTIGELHNIFPELMYTPYNEIQRPRLDIFLKHYPDVFIKLTPLKGE
jgi:hypothetical protein